MSTRRTVSGVGVVAALVVLAGCGGGNDADAPSGSPGPTSRQADATQDACRLITTDEVAEVLGKHNPGTAPYSVTATTGSDGSCTYAWTAASGGGDEFTVDEFPASGYVAQPGVDPRPIPGIGDEAFEEVGSFYARVGEEMVNVVNLQEGEGSDETLLQIAAGRLGSS
jgi:hypothetical protein